MEPGRPSGGQFLAASTLRWPVDLTPVEAEAGAFCNVLGYIRESCLKGIQKLLWMQQSLVQVICRVGEDFLRKLFLFYTRLMSGRFIMCSGLLMFCAHMLAKFALAHPANSWLVDPPHFLQGCLVQDLSQHSMVQA
ncbi:uncharacterized protein LOC119990524 isoform X2 [Tripterygium wilfordii]|uniref:uncharacterized protein LOC119990524 isoform X2 n=1 Tax=Tripterygium wilfordii TaxID=458696 RepID=UPI0018F7E7CD|nr:uncharacterized protein LOC119990524 isoform X2 [Tripterygium wilfordii]